jgi:C_GCAxxG_C_C family probable redox protein
MKQLPGSWTEHTSLAHTAVVTYYQGQDMNCSESLLRAGNDRYELALEEKSLRTAAPFGAGMAIESVCGALTGALMVLANLFVEHRAHESERVKEITADFLRGFEQEHGSMICRELKEQYHDDELSCAGVVRRAAAFLEAFITRRDTERVR